jgi:hypothetical protein
MKKTLLSIIIVGAILLVVVVAAINVSNRMKYDDTVKVLMLYAKGFCDGAEPLPPRLDAWGNPFVVKDKNSIVMYVSKGADLKSEGDDIHLMIDKMHTSYSISYTYKSRHVSKGFFPSTKKLP